MFYTGPEIKKVIGRVKSGDLTLPIIDINPFDENKCGSNSYDLHLSNKLLSYDLKDGEFLDPNKDNPVIEHIIPDEGIILYPNTLYLGSTIESTRTEGLVPCIEGRSSIGRLGISVHITAGFGDDGFDGTWTLEIQVIHPTKFYAGMKICQIYYSTMYGERYPYKGRYINQNGPIASRFWKGS